MSSHNDTDTDPVRQDNYSKISKSSKNRPIPPVDEDEEVDSNFDPLDRNRLYTPRTLQQSLRVGRKIYNALLTAGLPHTIINRRYFFSGRLVIEFMESRTQQNGGQTKRP